MKLVCYTIIIGMYLEHLEKQDYGMVLEKYIGTKIFVDDEELFGWIRVEITNGWNLTLIDYACTVGY